MCFPKIREIVVKSFNNKFVPVEFCNKYTILKRRRTYFNEYMNTWIIPPINMITHISDETRDINCDRGIWDWCNVGVE